MSAYFTHTLEMNRDEIVAHGPGKSLALVDLDSYRSFAGRDTDELDLMVHLDDQMNALTAFAWDVPDGTLNLRLIATGDHRAMERITFANRPPTASGTIRTHGRLCLVGHDRLLDCARDPCHSLLKGARLPKDEQPHLLNVQPGIYYALAYYRFPYPDGFHPGYASAAEAKFDYTIFLHHYPHPAPRVAPVRLTGGLIPWAGEESAARPWGGSHKVPDFSDSV
jgi:hypothetical protein